MGNPHLSYLNERGTAWFNCSYGILGFWDEYRKISQRLPDRSFQYVWSHRDLKRAKEIYAISIIAKVMEKQEKTGIWWIKKPHIDPPDGVIGTLLEQDGVRKMCVREIEVVEHIDGDILNTIRSKLAKKKYEENTLLVCYLSQGGIYDFEELSRSIISEATNLNHIFLVFPGAKVDDIPQGASNEELIRALFKVSSVQIKPVFSFSSIDPISDCKALRDGKEPAFHIFEGLGKGNSRAITLDNPPRLF